AVPAMAVAVGVDVAVAVAVAVPVAVAVLQVPALIEPAPAVVAVAGPQVVLFLASRAVVAQLARRHRQEQAVVPVDQLHVADDEGVVERQRAERLEAAAVLTAEVDPYFRQFHDTPRDKRRGRPEPSDPISGPRTKPRRTTRSVNFSAPTHRCRKVIHGERKRSKAVRPTA